MKAIKCEMCGSTDVIKQNDFYVCQSCGTKYSAEEAKKLFVDVSGSTVKIDKSEDVRKAIVNADRAYDAGRYDEACGLYDKVLDLDGEESYALFKRGCCVAATSTLEDLKLDDMATALVEGIKREFDKHGDSAEFMDYYSKVVHYGANILGELGVNLAGMYKKNSMDTDVFKYTREHFQTLCDFSESMAYPAIDPEWIRNSPYLTVEVTDNLCAMLSNCKNCVSTMPVESKKWIIGIDNSYAELKKLKNERFAVKPSVEEQIMFTVEGVKWGYAQPAVSGKVLGVAGTLTVYNTRMTFRCGDPKIDADIALSEISEIVPPVKVIEMDIILRDGNHYQVLYKNRGQTDNLRTRILEVMNGSAAPQENITAPTVNVYGRKSIESAKKNAKSSHWLLWTILIIAAVIAAYFLFFKGGDSSGGGSSGSSGGYSYNSNDKYYSGNDYNNDGKINDEEFQGAVNDWMDDHGY